MKKIKILLLLLFTAAETGFAQNAASLFTVDGIDVIYKPTAKHIVNVKVYFRGGVTNYPVGQAGIENLAVTAAATCGAGKYSKDAFKDRADEFDINVYGTAAKDNSLIGLDCIDKYFSQGWDLLVQAVTTPLFEQDEFNRTKQKALSSLNMMLGQPDNKLIDMVMQNTFAGTPYAINPNGTDSTLSPITAAAAKEYYYNTLLNKARMFIVVVGPVSKADITERVHTAFASVKTQPYQPVPLKAPAFTGNTLHVEERQLATNYIGGILSSPLYTSKDYLPNRLAFSSLLEKFMVELRTKRNLSYAPAAFVTTGLISYDALYISTTDPKTSVEVMVSTVNGLKKNGFTDNDLTAAKANFITSNYMKQESTDAIAASLGKAEICGDWKKSEEMPNLVRTITKEDMTNAFRKYTTGIQWNYLGSKPLADSASEAFNRLLVQ